MGFVFNMVIFLVTLGVIYAVFSEGLWGSTLLLLDVVFAGMITLNYYEPLATLINEKSEAALGGFTDMLCFMGLLLVSLGTLRGLTTAMSNNLVRFPGLVDLLGRAVMAVLAGVLTMGLLLSGLYTAPVQKQILGSVDTIDPEGGPPFQIAGGFDRAWLKLFEFGSKNAFASRDQDGAPNAFDYDDWLAKLQNARPYGEAPSGEAVPTETAPGTTPTPGSTAPTVPGGTAGAAAGLAPTGP
jgi:hypothetical protein